MKQEQVTKVAFKEAPDGDPRITSETAFNAKLKEKAEAKEPLPEQISSGTFLMKFAESVDEAVQLAGGTGVGEYENVEIFLAVFNYGAALRQHNTAKEILISDNFEAWEGSKDMSFSIAQKVERAKMSPEERAIKDLAKGGIVVTPDQLRAALALIQQQSAQPQVAAG